MAEDSLAGRRGPPRDRLSSPPAWSSGPDARYRLSGLKATACNRRAGLVEEWAESRMTLGLRLDTAIPSLAESSGQLLQELRVQSTRLAWHPR